MPGIFVLLVLAIFIGALLGWISFFKIGKLQDKVDVLSRELTYLKSVKSEPEVSEEAFVSNEEEVELTTEKETISEDDQYATERKTISVSEPNVIDHLFESLRKDWMVWLGGVCVGLSGIFLVKYSIEQGLLGPLARITLAIITGIAFHILAEWLRRRTNDYHPSFAALAGGASIILYAALLAALHLYHLLTPMLVFSLLALVSIVTMHLALLHGPVLAIIGILGAYFVPILVSTGSGNILIALIYSLIITGASLGLMRYVYRNWLWFGMLAGALGWWFLSLTSVDADGVRGVYLAVLAYMVSAIPLSDWFLQERIESDNKNSTNKEPVFIALLLIIFALGISIMADGFMSYAILRWSPFIIVLFMVCRYRDELSKLPWVSLVVQCLAWLQVGYTNGQDQLFSIDKPDETGFLYFIIVMSLLYSTFAFWNHRVSTFKSLYSSLAVLAPVCWLALANLLVSGLSSSVEWALGSAALGACYIIFSVRRLALKVDDELSVWLILGGHFAYSLAVAMFFREAGLTLALAAQILTLAWIIKRFELPSLAWLLKLIVAVVVCRLTLNPWLPEYQADVHWTLWTYGGATVFSLLAAWQLNGYPDLRKWAEAAALHLLVLTLWSETRYWLYDGAVFSERYSFTEAAINTTLWSALGLVYHLRGQMSKHIQPFYEFASLLLLFAALINYGLLLTLKNPLWTYQEISQNPLWNLLLLAYGMPIVMAALIAHFYQDEYKSLAKGICGIAGFAFISLEIRHLWQSGFLHLDRATSNGELYTYSIVWLLMAAIAIFAGGIRYGRQVYKAGMLLLVLVIGKIFLIDMSGLTGLLRVASFMGLGVSLLALAYMHQRFQFQLKINHHS